MRTQHSQDLQKASRYGCWYIQSQQERSCSEIFLQDLWSILERCTEAEAPPDDPRTHRQGCCRSQVDVAELRARLTTTGSPLWIDIFMDSYTALVTDDLDLLT